MTDYQNPSGEVPHIQNANFRAWIEGTDKWKWLLWPSRLCTPAQYTAALADALADYIDYRLEIFDTPQITVDPHDINRDARSR